MPFIFLLLCARPRLANVDATASVRPQCWVTGVCVGIYYEGIYMVKVILAEIRHFECPNEKVEENRLVTKSSILSMESLGWPNTQIQIHKYTNMCI